MKKIIKLLIIALLLTPAVGCTTEAADPANVPEENTVVAKSGNQTTPEAPEEREDKEEEKEKEPVEETNEASVKETKEDPVEKSEEEIRIKLFYPTESYIVDGIEDKKMDFIEKSVTGTVEETIREIPALLANSPDKEGLENFITEDTVRQVEFKDGVVTVDLNGAESPKGSQSEEVVLNQIIRSMLSVEGVKGVAFTVDGEPAESFGGHYDLTKTYTEGI